MSVHPPAPSDLGAIVDAYAQTVRSIIDLGRTMHRGEESLPTDCPGWTVLDQIAHVASTEAMVAGEPEPARVGADGEPDTDAEIPLTAFARRLRRAARPRARS